MRSLVKLCIMLIMACIMISGCSTKNERPETELLTEVLTLILSPTPQEFITQLEQHAILNDTNLPFVSSAENDHFDTYYKELFNPFFEEAACKTFIERYAQLFFLNDGSAEETIELVRVEVENTDTERKPFSAIVSYCGQEATLYGYMHLSESGKISSFSINALELYNVLSTYRLN